MDTHRIPQRPEERYLVRGALALDDSQLAAAGPPFGPGAAIGIKPPRIRPYVLAIADPRWC